MKKEQHEKATEIIKHAKGLRDHLNRVFYQKGEEEPFESIEASISSNQGNNYSTHTLINKYLPIPIKTYMKLYRQNIEEQIISLEQEFEQL